MWTRCSASLRPGPFGYPIPTIIYTQHALSSLPPQWVTNLEKTDAIIVPGEFDRIVFSKHFDDVHVCPQHVDERVFRPIERWRSEGVDAFTFAFVGSYGYRKGVNHIWEAFRRAFPEPDDSPVHLALHCFQGANGNNMSHLINGARSLPAHIGLTVTTGTLTTPWMNRYYNRVDAVFTFSRGEGWCMPLHEGLLCGKPVIAPDSTAMGEALPESGVRRVSVHETPIASTTNPFGASMRRAYGVDGAVQWDVDLDDAAQALRDVRDSAEAYREGAAKGAEFIRKTYSIDTLGARLDSILDTFGNRMSLM